MQSEPSQPKKPWISILVVVLCAVWIIARLIYFYTSGNCSSTVVQHPTSNQERQPLNVNPQTSDIKGILPADLDLLKAKAVNDPGFSNAFSRLTARRRELAAQQTALEFDYKNWLNSWSTTNRAVQTKIARFRSLSRQDQSNPDVAAKLAKVSASLKKTVGEDPVGAALLARCDAILLEAESVETLYRECARAAGLENSGKSPASNKPAKTADKEQSESSGESAVKAPSVEESVSIAASVAISTNIASEVKAVETTAAETKELKE